jgi:hypothetical protein
MAWSPSTASASALVLSDVLVAEHYLPFAESLRADELTLLLGAGEGRLLHALYLPGDETCFAVYSGATPASRAVSPPSPLDRIVPALLLAREPGVERKRTPREQGRNGR